MFNHGAWFEYYLEFVKRNMLSFVNSMCDVLLDESDNFLFGNSKKKELMVELIIVFGIRCIYIEHS
jgi:hypothetical protein